MDSSTIYLIITMFVGASIETVEATTIVLASGITRGWRSTFEGAGLAVILLAAIVGIAGKALVVHVPLPILRIVVGFLLLVFGLQWLYKNILRTAGYRPTHDEAVIFQKNVNNLSKAPSATKGKRDPFAFAISFKGVFLEGMEIVIMVISFGAPVSPGAPDRLGLAALVAGVAILVIGSIGALTAKPLSKLPEEWMKLGVGMLLSLFGMFWMGEGARINWPLGDAFLLVILAVLLVVTLTMMSYLKRIKQRAQAVAA